jgi:hypothetical protein
MKAERNLKKRRDAKSLASRLRGPLRPLVPQSFWAEVDRFWKVSG